MGSVTMSARTRVRLALVTAAAVVASTGLPVAGATSQGGAAAPGDRVAASFDAAAAMPTEAAPDLRWGAEVGDHPSGPLVMGVGGDGTTVVGAGEGVVRTYDPDGSVAASFTTNADVRDIAVDAGSQRLAVAATLNGGGSDLVIEDQILPLGSSEAVVLAAPDGADAVAWPVLGGSVERVEWVGDDVVLLAQAWAGEAFSVNGHVPPPVSPEERYVVARVDAVTGAPVWSVPFDASAANDPRLGVGGGGVAVVLQYPGGDLGVLRFTLDGALQGVRGVDIPAGFLDVRSVAVGPTGEIVIGGQGSSEETRVSGGADGSDLGAVRGMFALRIDAAGEPSWLHTGATGWQSRIDDLAVASDGTVSITGSTSATGFTEVNAGPGGSSFVAAIGADGVLRWVDRLGRRGMQRLELDALGRAVVAAVPEEYSEVPTVGRPPADIRLYEWSLGLFAYGDPAPSCHPDLRVEASIEPEDVDAGIPTRLAVRLTNDGTCTAQVPLVQYDPTLPWWDMTQGYGFDGFGAWHVGNLGPGATAEAWLEVGADAIRTPMTVRVLPWPGDPDPNPANDVATTIPECATVEPSVSVTPDSAEWTPTGTVGAVEVTVTNTSFCDLDEQVTVRIGAPYLTGVTPAVGSTVSEAPGVTWTFDGLPAGEQATLTADLHVPADIAPTAHGIEVWLDEPGWSSGFAQTTFTVLPRCADLRLGLGVNRNPVLVGETVRFELWVKNQGTCNLLTPSSVALRGPLIDEVLEVRPLVAGEKQILYRYAVGALSGAEPYVYQFHTATLDAVGDPAFGNSASTSVVVTRPAVITGVVTGPDGQPASGVVVQAFTPTGPLVPAAAFSVADADGRFRIETPLFGEHKLYAFDLLGRFHASWFGGAASRPASPSVSTTWGSIAEVDAQLAARAPGSLVVDVSGPGGAPRSAVWVSVFDADGHVRSGRTQADGRVALRDLAPGTYWLRAVPLDDPAGAEWWRDRDSRGTAHPLVVADGPVLVSVQLDR